MKSKMLALGLAVSLMLGNVGYAAGDVENIKKEPIQITNIIQNKNIKIKSKDINKKENAIDTRIELPVISGLSNKKFQDGLNSRIEEEALESLESFKEEIKGKKGSFFLNYSIKSKGDILSIVIEEYRDSEVMAGGINTIKTYNINTINNEDINLKDLFVKGSNYKEKIDKNIKAQIEKNKELYFLGEEGFNGIDEESKFFIDKELNLVIVYDQDEIAPHSTGLVKFVIDNKDLNDIYDLSGMVENKNYTNKEYGFGFRIPETWKDRVEIREERLSKDGLYRVDFIYMPVDKSLKEAKLLSLKVRDLDDKLGKDEFDLVSENYKYTAVYYNLKESPYKKGSDEAKNFELVSSALDGTDDLFMLIENVSNNEYRNEKYNFSFVLPPAWDNYVIVKENDSPKTGLFELDFIFTPSNKKDESVNFFTLSVREKGESKLGETEGILAEGNYIYVGQYKAMKKLPYEKGSKSQEEFIKVNDVLNGAEELIKINNDNVELKDMKNILINDKKVALENKMYLNKNGEIMLPLRQIATELGFEVSWDHPNRLAELKKMPITAGVYVGQNKNYFLNALINLEEKSELVKGKTYVPEKFFVEVLGGSISIEDDGVLNLNY